VKKRVPEFLKELEQIKAQGIELKLYQDTLDDTMDDLHDVLKNADKAAKQLQMNPPKKKSHGGARR
jgi:predicted Zn-ribbon and HTH transcriptional regulator